MSLSPVNNLALSRAVSYGLASGAPGGRGAEADGAELGLGGGLCFLQCEIGGHRCRFGGVSGEIGCVAIPLCGLELGQPGLLGRQEQEPADLLLPVGGPPPPAAGEEDEERGGEEEEEEGEQGGCQPGLRVGLAGWHVCCVVCDAR